jgi:uroporphyrinogen decarboxylase
MAERRADEKLMLRALKGKPVPRPPFWLMRQAGRYLPEYREARKKTTDFLAFCYTPDLAVEVTLQPLRRYGMDAAILFSDILVVPDGLGQPVRFKEREGPVLEAIGDVRDLEGFSVRRMHERLAPVYETVERLARAIPSGTALIGFAGAPWTVATYMVEGRASRDYATVRGWAYREPEGFGRLIDLLVTATAEYLIEQARRGTEVLQLFDSWAGVLPEGEFRRWVVAPTAEIVRRIKAACPGVPVIGFPRGAGVMCEAYARETGVDGISLDATVPVLWARERLQPACAVQGNLDNLLLVAGGTAMEEETRRILSVLGGGRFIFNLGHGIVPETPPDHVARLAEIVKGWRG